MRKDVLMERCLSAKLAIIHAPVILGQEEGEWNIYENALSQLYIIFVKEKQAKNRESSLKRDHAGFDFVCIFGTRLHVEDFECELTEWFISLTWLFYCILKRPTGVLTRVAESGLDLQGVEV